MYLTGGLVPLGRKFLSPPRSSRRMAGKFKYLQSEQDGGLSVNMCCILQRCISRKYSFFLFQTIKKKKSKFIVVNMCVCLRDIVFLAFVLTTFKTLLMPKFVSPGSNLSAVLELLFLACLYTFSGMRDKKYLS